MTNPIDINFENVGLPNEIVHFYQAAGPDEDVWVYEGPLELTFQDTQQETFEGDVRLSWRPTPRIIWRAQVTDVARLFTNMTGGLPSITRVAIPPTAAQLPEQPRPSSESSDGNDASPYNQDGWLEPTNLGAQNDIDRVTFLVINGPDAWDLETLGSVSKRTAWQGRLQFTHGDYKIVIDKRCPTPVDVFSELRKRGGYAATHVGEIIKVDKSAFSSTDATDLLAGLSAGLSLAVGRYAQTVLPVGYLSGKAVWTMFAAPNVDSHRGSFTWLDPSISGMQLRETLPAIIGHWLDPDRRNAIRYALGYYLDANNGRPVETALASAISGVLLLAEAELQGATPAYSKSQWDKLKTPGQVRALLDEYRISTATPPQYQDLGQVEASVRTRSQGQPQRHTIDGIAAVLALRNSVIHPTPENRTVWPTAAWPEAWLLSEEWLALAILRRLGYQGNYKSRLDTNRWAGSVDPVPWGATP